MDWILGTAQERFSRMSQVGAGATARSLVIELFFILASGYLLLRGIGVLR